LLLLKLLFYFYFILFYFFDFQSSGIYSLSIEEVLQQEELEINELRERVVEIDKQVCFFFSLFCFSSLTFFTLLFVIIIVAMFSFVLFPDRFYTKLSTSRCGGAPGKSTEGHQGRKKRG
jgi:hypothetical protein